MTRTHILGFPRIGAGRELKFALEAFWRGELDDEALEAVGRSLRERHWALQREAGLSFVTVGDFSFYDTMLDHTALLGAIPPRFGFGAGALTLRQLFELARGGSREPPLEMTKWFDTNYHYLVPELEAGMRFGAGSGRLFAEVEEALPGGVPVKPVLIGPVTYLRLAKSASPGFERLELLPQLVHAYAHVLQRLHASCVEWVQLDEPALCTDLEPEWLDAMDYAYGQLSGQRLKLLLATYFGSTAEYAARIARLPVHGIHLDCIRAPDSIDVWRGCLPNDWVLSAGVVDGRNVWRNDLRSTVRKLRPLRAALGDRLWIAPSCSLLHVPVTLAGEDRLDPEVKPWLAFATEKMAELGAVSRALAQGDDAVRDAYDASDEALRARRESKRVVNEFVRREVERVKAAPPAQRAPFQDRAEAQRAALQLPLFPTTTIGSFPQTQTLRNIRAAHRRGEIGALEYLRHIRGEIELAVRRQEALGLDVLVHGEAERTDMVEFFAEQLWGFARTTHGWVQSYGSRCVKPPIIYGDVSRPEPMTVETIAYAQSLTAKPVKGMLTGPVTMLQWSFVRDDEPRENVALQIALAIRDEVTDLENAGVRVIQIDEPALREGLPLKRLEWDAYLTWAVRAFGLCAAHVGVGTQIHTHMCYAEFRDILPAITALDADVITIETSRSNMALLDAFGDFAYPNDIGPGVYDIHSPRIPATGEMLRLLLRAAEVIPARRLWINPDCGLKTRDWAQTQAALRNMVEAAARLREEYAQS